jgi:hypothetical protein
LPVAVADLVADQRVARGGIGNAQQGLGQAHQRHALLRAEREFLQQALHQTGAAAGARTLAHTAGDTQGQRMCGRGLGWRQCRLGQECWQHGGLGSTGGGGDRGAQWFLL